MAHILVFYAVQCAICAYAIRAGGRPEAATALVLLVAAVATTLFDVARVPSYAGVNVPVLLIDVGLMLALVVVVAVADRYWPLWVASLHLLAIGVHGARAWDAGLVPAVYAAATGKIAYPMLALLAIGTWRHRRRMRAFGRDADWCLPRWAA